MGATGRPCLGLGHDPVRNGKKAISKQRTVNPLSFSPFLVLLPCLFPSIPSLLLFQFLKLSPAPPKLPTNSTARLSLSKATFTPMRSFLVSLFLVGYVAALAVPVRVHPPLCTRTLVTHPTANSAISSGTAKGTHWLRLVSPNSKQEILQMGNVPQRRNPVLGTGNVPQRQNPVLGTANAVCPMVNAHQRQGMAVLGTANARQRQGTGALLWTANAVCAMANARQSHGLGTASARRCVVRSRHTTDPLDDGCRLGWAGAGLGTGAWRVAVAGSWWTDPG